MLPSHGKTLHYSYSVTVCNIQHANDTGPQIKSAICIDENLMLNVFVNLVKLNKVGQFVFPMKVNSIHLIEQVCDTLNLLTNSSDNSRTENKHILILNLILSLLIPLQGDSFQFHSVIIFISEQFRLMTLKALSYSYDFLIFCSILYNISPISYRYLRHFGNFILPCYSTIHKVILTTCMSPFNEQTDSCFLQYIKHKFKELSLSNKTIILLIDEIHIKPYFDFKAGNIVGCSYNSQKPATSAFVFMIQSILSDFKDVVHVVPVHKLSAADLHVLIKKTVKGLEIIGFHVICVVTDNNAINGKAMSFFLNPPKLSIVYPHPCDIDRPLFFMFDSVHI